MGPAYCQTNDSAPAKESTPESPTLALVGGTVHTADSSGILKNGVVLISDGKISAVGEGLDVPAGARVIDCAGLTITPGLIDARSRLWADPGSINQSGGDGSLDAFDALNPYSEDWIDVVRGGVTTVYLQPGNADVCAGVGVVVSAAPHDDEIMVLARDAGLQTALGVGNDLSGRGRSRQFDKLKKVFADTKKYQDDWKKYNDYQAKLKAKEDAAKKADDAKKADGEANDGGKEGDKKDESASKTEDEADGKKTPPTPPNTPDSPRRGSGRRGGRPGTDSPGRPAESTEPGSRPAADDKEKDASKGEKEADKGDSKTDDAKADEKPPVKPKWDATKERLTKALTGELSVRIEVRHPDDARRALELAKEFKLKLVLEGVTGSGSALPDLMKSRYPLIVGPWISNDDYNQDLKSLWTDGLGDHDGRIVFSTFGSNAASSRGLRTEVATAIALGCKPEVALQAVTMNAAVVIGMSDQLGSISVGKRADLAVFAGDPFDISVPVQMTLVGGEVVYGGAAKAVSSSQHLIDESKQLPISLPDEYVVTSRRVLMPDGSLAHRSLIVKDGMITDNRPGDAEGEGIAAKRFDLGDAVITPGLFSAKTNLGIPASTFNSAESDSRHLSAADGFDPTNDNVAKMTRSGITTALLVPSGPNTLAGRAALIRLSAAEAIAHRDVGDTIVLSASGRNQNKYPATLAGQLEFVHSLLSREPIASRMYLPVVTQRLIDKDRDTGTQNLLAGKRLALFETNSDAETRAALGLIEKYKLRAAIYGITNIDNYVERLAATNTVLIVSPMDSATPQWKLDSIAAASAAGVKIVWHGENGVQLRQSAAAAVEHGMDESAVLLALSSMGVKSLVDLELPHGLESGARADFVVWTGVPFDLRSLPTAVVVDGQCIPDTNHRKGETSVQK